MHSSQSEINIFKNEEMCRGLCLTSRAREKMWQNCEFSALPLISLINNITPSKRLTFAYLLNTTHHDQPHYIPPTSPAPRRRSRNNTRRSIRLRLQRHNTTLVLRPPPHQPLSITRSTNCIRRRWNRYNINGHLPSILLRFRSERRISKPSPKSDAQSCRHRLQQLQW